MAERPKLRKLRLRRLRSECGRYYAERDAGDSRYRLFDHDGNFLGRATYWSNRSTNTRVGFETGFGTIAAQFSYPRHPAWFRRRWVLCFDVWIDELAKLAEGFGCEVLVGYKPDINCWSHLGVRATAEQVRLLDQELTRRGVEWNGPPHKPGQWEIDCPASARWATKQPEVPDA